MNVFMMRLGQDTDNFRNDKRNDGDNAEVDC